MKLGVRIFGRVRAFDCACPRCGEPVRVSTRGAPWKDAWNPRQSRWRCRKCGKVYYVGLILWDPDPGGRHFPPEDTIPTEQQSAALRGNLNVWAKQRRPGGRLKGKLTGAGVNRLIGGDPLKLLTETEIGDQEE